MRKIALSCLILALAIPSRAFAQLATTKFYNLVDTPVAVTFNASGQAQIKVSPAGAVINVTGFRRVSVQVGSTHATNLRIQIGKISGTTLSSYLYNGPANQQIRTYEIVGPELVLVLSGAPANSTDHVQLWVYLTT